MVLETELKTLCMSNMPPTTAIPPQVFFVLQTSCEENSKWHVAKTKDKDNSESKQKGT